MAGAELLLVNGIGYDDWAEKARRGQPDSSRRIELTVGDVARAARTAATRTSGTRRPTVHAG